MCNSSPSTLPASSAGFHAAGRAASACSGRLFLDCPTPPYPAQKHLISIQALHLAVVAMLTCCGCICQHRLVRSVQTGMAWRVLYWRHDEAKSGERMPKDRHLVRRAHPASGWGGSIVTHTPSKQACALRQHTQMRFMHANCLKRKPLTALFCPAIDVGTIVSRLASLLFLYLGRSRAARALLPPRRRCQPRPTASIRKPPHWIPQWTSSPPHDELEAGH